jgi:hypothetical protein
MPLSTRGREVGIADSGILIIDSGFQFWVMQKDAPSSECGNVLSAFAEKRLIPL